MVPRAVFVCVCTLSISSTLGSKSWALAQTIQQPAISPWHMHHHLHTDTSTSLHLISVHSLTLSLACLSGLAVFFFLFLIFWFCYHHHHFHHLCHPLAPVSRKIHQIINITIQIPDPPILQSTTHLLLPTGHHPTHTPHTSHLTPQTTNLRLHPNSDPFLESPAQNHPTRVQIRVRSALCALRTASPSLTRLEARDTRCAPAWAACYPRPVLELSISSLRSALCDVYVSASGLDPGPYPSSNETLGKHSTIYPRSGLSTGLLELQLLAHLLHPRATSQKRKRTQTQRSRLCLRLLCIHLLLLLLQLLLWLCIPCTVRS